MSAQLAQLWSQLQFLRPLWLLALPLLPLLAWWRVRAVRQRGGWAQDVDAHLLPHLLVGEPQGLGRAWQDVLGWLGMALVILALAGPSLHTRAQPLWQSRQPLVVALDLSQAMHGRDLPPDRLSQARAKLATLLRQRQGGEVALVVFADDAYTVAPLTFDAANVALFLDALAPEVMPADGHRVDRAIDWSRKLLRQAGLPRGEILLLTDRANPAAFAAAARARADGYRVSVLGVGRASGGLDEVALQTLAARGGGRYQPISPGDADLRALGVLDPGQMSAAPGDGTARLRQDEGYWLLPLAMLCLLPWLRRGAGVLAVLVLLWGPSLPAQAQTSV